jgi:acylphosphatase
MPARRFQVHGQVQGVGFRFFVLRHARALGLRGFVRNLPSGAVEVVAAGPESALSQLERELRIGPRLACVTKVEKEEISDELYLTTDFHIAG